MTGAYKITADLQCAPFIAKQSQSEHCDTSTYHASYLYFPVDGLPICHLCILCEFQLNGYSDSPREWPCSDKGLLCMPYWPVVHVVGDSDI